MDEENQFVLLQFNNEIPVDPQKHREVLPNANSLFKEIEDETEAMKELQGKKNNNNIYEKVKKSLVDKLSYGRLTRGMSADEQLSIRDMISTCNQRKHIRSFDVWKKDAETISQRYKARSRNYSAKESKKDPSGSHQQKVRPKTSKISTSGTRSTQLFRHTAGDTLNFSFLNTIPEDKQCKLKKHSKIRNFSKIIENKENEEISTAKSYYLGFSHLNREAIETKKGTDKKLQRSRHQFKNRFENIIDHCKFEKKSMKFLDKKIHYFEYFCDKVTKDKSVIQNFCNRMDSVKFMFDDQFD